MLNKMVITRLSSEKDSFITARYEEGKIVELAVEKPEEASILGNIYIGKVKNIVPSIQAAFIEIAPGQECYFSLTENPAPHFTNPKTNPNVIIGDEIIVQVTKEGIKTKAPVVSSNLNFTGKYVVLTSKNTKLGLSGKLSVQQKKQLREKIAPIMTQEHGLIIRTNAVQATDEQLFSEIEKLKSRYQKMIQDAPYRTCYSILFQSAKGYINHVKNAYSSTLSQIVTDQPNIYEELLHYIKEEQPEDEEKLFLYEDETYPLTKLYHLEGELRDALMERVWLKSGAYLVIEPTEAFTVIDVNTGKFSRNKKKQETFFKINMEAAKEIARQLRLRNISGIIVIDFIDLKEKERQHQLMENFQKFLKRDPVQTTVVGISKLNLVEVTRKKVRKSLREQAGVICPTCHGRGFLW